MGILSDFFTCAEDELDRALEAMNDILDDERGRPRPSARAMEARARHCYVMMKRWTPSALADLAVAVGVPVERAEPVAVRGHEGAPNVHWLPQEHGPAVVRLPAEIRDALADANDAALAGIGERWLDRQRAEEATRPYYREDPAALERALASLAYPAFESTFRDLKRVADFAKTHGWPMYVWLCL